MSSAYSASPRSGASPIPTPVSVPMPAHDQAAALRSLVNRERAVAPVPVRRAPSAAARTLAVASGKGGVGKTSMTVNLAVQLTRLGAPGGFRLVPGASGLAHMADLDAAQIQRLTAAMTRLEETADVILIDTAAGVGKGVLGFCAAADRLLVVTTPEPTAITDAYALIKTLNTQVASADIHLLVNMVRDEAQGRA